MPQKQRRKLSADEVKMLASMASIRLPKDQQARVLGMSVSTLDRCLKYDNAARERVEKAEASASNNIRKRAYDLAMDGNVPMLIFWLKTQEGFRENDRLELSGPDGGPIKFAELSREQKEMKLQKLLAIKALANVKIEVPIDEEK